MASIGTKYTRKDDGDKYTCIYCGELADTEDHVPPQSIAENMTLDMEHILVPSCNECNSTLNKLYLLKIDERAAHLKTRYAKKYRKYNRVVSWDKSEIDELDGSLRTFIRGSQYEYERLRDRLRTLDHRIYHGDTDLETRR